MNYILSLYLFFDHIQVHRQILTLFNAMFAISPIEHKELLLRKLEEKKTREAIHKLAANSSAASHEMKRQIYILQVCYYFISINVNNYKSCNEFLNR